MKIKPLELALSCLFLILAAVTGWLLISDADRKTASPKETDNPRLNPILVSETPQAQTSGRNRTKSQSETNLSSLLARPNERLVLFNNEEDYRNFLKAATKSNLRLLGNIDRLRAARVGFTNISDLNGLVDPNQTGPNFLVSLPLPPGGGSVQAGAVGFRQNALEWLGIDEDNSAWGEDITVAVIDTGVVDHEALPNNVTHFDLVSAEDPSTERSGHGTAVASLIVGQNDIAAGVSPASQLIDVRVANSEGISDSFLLAEGIITAVDAGADVLNISLGSLGDSPVVENAVDYALESGAVIVASSGNEGFDQPSFPAGYEDVIAVGAVDLEGTLVDFSNTGENLDITAPGLELPAAWTDENYILFTGTSASAPFVSGAIATAMDQFQLNPTQAAEYVLDFANEAGAPGEDTNFGAGHLDVGRVIDSTTPGIHDIATVSNLIVTDESSSVISVVQNQGTEFISSAELTISTPFATIPLRVNNLPPGEIQTFDIPTTLPKNGTEFSITSEATLNETFQDADPTNNVQATSFSVEVDLES